MVGPGGAALGDAKFFQIVGRQLRQNSQVDLVLAKSPARIAPARAPQPAPNVHRVVPALGLRRIVRAKDNAWEPMMRPK